MSGSYDRWRVSPVTGAVRPADGDKCPVCECSVEVGNGHLAVQCVWELKQMILLLQRRVETLEAHSNVVITHYKT